MAVEAKPRAVPPDKDRIKGNRWGTILDVLRDTIFSNGIYLSAHEEAVLLFIFKRTRMYGREWEAIPLRHFTEGVWSRDNGDVCSRLVMKANTVIEARDHLRGKGIIEVREHTVRAYQYRICEPDEIVQHDIVAYLAKHQPKQLAALVRELRRNRKRLPPEFLRVLEIAEGKTVRVSPGHSQDAPRDTMVIPRRVERALPYGAQPTNKPNARMKRPIKNIAPEPGARSGSEYCSKTPEKNFRMLPRPKLQSDKAQEFQLALIEAANWKNTKRAQRLSKPSVKTWQKAWSDAMKVHYPAGVANFPDRAFRNLKLAIEKWHIPAEQVSPLINWTIENWQHARRSIFTYNTGKPFGPHMPDVGLFISKIDGLHTAFDWLAKGILIRHGNG